ncbi:ornithine cyclodeaminase/mu-crystallin family protein [Ensifer adhaerens]|nr:ornithine cyclodeaminase/mu-crystallin family protein [Ensifer adhaerens]
MRYHFRVFPGKTVRLRIHETAGNTPVPAATDIIITVTADKQSVTVLADNHVGPSGHINAVTGDCPAARRLSQTRKNA